MPKSAATISKLGGTFPFILSTRFENSTELFPYAADTFTRGDAASTVGSTELTVGSVAIPWTAYTVNGGTLSTLGVSSQKLYTSTNASDTALVVDSGSSDGVMRFTVSTPSSGASGAEVGLIFRHSRVTNGSFYLFIWRGPGTGNPNVVEFYKNVSSSYTSLANASTPPTLVAGDVLTVVWSGSNFAIYRNGVLGLAFTDTSITTGTGVGYRSNGSSASLANRLDNFECYPAQASTLGQLTLPASSSVPLMNRSSLTKPVAAVTPAVNMAAGSPQAPLIACSLDSGLNWTNLTNKARNYLGAITTSVRFRLTNQSSTLVDTFARPGKTRGIYDSFARSGSLGTGDSGQTWVVAGGSFVVVNGYVYQANNTTGASTATFDTAVNTYSGILGGFTTYDYTVTVVNDNNNSAIPLVRYQDANNHIRLNLDGNLGIAYLQSVIGGTVATLGSLTIDTVTSAAWRISVTPSTLAVYRNGALVIGPVANSSFASSTSVGFWTYSTATGSSTRYSNLSVTTSSYTARTAAELFNNPFYTSSGHKMQFQGTQGTYINAAGKLVGNDLNPAFMTIELGTPDRDITFVIDSRSNTVEWDLVLRQGSAGSTYVFLSSGGQIGVYDSAGAGSFIVSQATFTPGATYRVTVIGNNYVLYRNGVAQSGGTGTSTTASTVTFIYYKTTNVVMSYFSVGPHPIPMTVEDASFFLETQT